jgi:D-aspartate ligase
MDFGHATTYAVTVDVPEIAELGKKLLRELGYWGIAEVEFMWDQRSQTHKFIEINGRFWGWHTLARAAGINFPKILHSYMHGVRTDAPSPALGTKWIRAITDIPTVLREIALGRLPFRDYLRTLDGCKEFAVFSSQDPLPSLIEIFLVPYLWAKRGF